MVRSGCLSGKVGKFQTLRAPNLPTLAADPLAAPPSRGKRRELPRPAEDKPAGQSRHQGLEPNGEIRRGWPCGGIAREPRAEEIRERARDASGQGRGIAHALREALRALARERPLAADGVPERGGEAEHVRRRADLP